MNKTDKNKKFVHTLYEDKEFAVEREEKKDAEQDKETRVEASVTYGGVNSEEEQVLQSDDGEKKNTDIGEETAKKNKSAAKERNIKCYIDSKNEKLKSSVKTTVSKIRAEVEAMERKIDERKAKSGGQKIEPEKPQLLILIVESVKAEFYADFLQTFRVNVCFTSYAKGTSSSFLGVEGTEKAVLFAPISEKRSKTIMEKLEEKFRTIRNGKGVAITVPFSGIIGLNSYSFLIDNRDAQNVINNKNLQTEDN